MTRRLRKKASLWPWVAAAAFLHGVLSLWLQLPQAAKPSSPRDVEPAKNELELVLLDEQTLTVPLEEEDNAPIDAKSATVHSALPVSRAPNNSLHTADLAEAKAPLDTDTPPPESASTLPQHGDAAPASSAPAVVAQAPVAHPTAPRSLAELGYGTPHPAALAPYLGVDATASAQNRLDQNLAQAIIDRDRDRSNGIEGPITQALHTAAMAVVVPTSLSKISVIIGSNGKLADFHIVSTNQDARALANLSERLKKLLAAQTIRVPNGRAVEFTYEIKSAVLMPSGRGPGLGVEVLGIPLKEGRADNSSKISILTPKFKFGPVSEPDPERNGKVTQTLPQLAIGISVLGLDGDLVDVGANERQVVHTRLIRQRVLQPTRCFTPTNSRWRQAPSVASHAHDAEPHLGTDSTLLRRVQPRGQRGHARVVVRRRGP